MTHRGRSWIGRGSGERAGARDRAVPGFSDGIRARASVLALALALLVGVVSLAAIEADAAGGPEFLVEFCPTGTGAGQCTGPRGVAASPINGHVYVGEAQNRRISEFTAWGEFVEAWGWNVAPDGAAGDTASDQFEICTAVCQRGTAATAASAGSGQLSAALGVAVDHSGYVYVVDQTVRRVQKFSPTGEFVLMFGGNVNKTKVEEVGSTPAERNVCTAASGNVCKAGSGGTAQGQFGAWKIGSFIGIGPSDTVYVGDENRIQEFNPDGSFKSEIPLAGSGVVESLTVEPSGNLYVTSEKVAGVRKISPDGTVLSTFCAGCAPKALASDSSGNVWMVDGAVNPTIRKFNSAGVELASFGAGEFSTSTAIGVNSIGDVYVANGTPTSSYIRAYGPLPNAFGEPPQAPPTIAYEYAAAVGTTSAVVRAGINPHFFPTTYYVEYGTADCAAAPCAQQPVPPGTALLSERERNVPTGDVRLSGLTPGTVYHYRFVAVSDGGTVFGLDRTFRSFLPGAFVLPDSRAYEMVSPPEKNSGEMAVPGNPGGLVDPGFSVRPLQASITGDAIAFPSFTAFGDAESAPAASTYLSERGAAGWSTENITPPSEEGTTRDPLRGFSPDLSLSAVVQKEPKLDPDAVEGLENLYLRDNGEGGLRALTTETPRWSGIYCVTFAGASASFDRVIFAATGALTPDAPELPYPATNLYEWAAGKLSLVSVLPDGTPATPTSSTAFGAPGNACTMNGSILHNAISADGSRIFWSSGGRLLARLHGTETIQLDEANGGSGPPGGGRFWAASDDGSKVFFTSPNSLTPGSSPPGLGLGDLYLYDFDAAPGEHLADITVDPTPGTDPPAVRGVVGTSEDGSYVYFVADGALDEDAVTGEPNLYVWHAGAGLRFIATLSGSDVEIDNSTGVVRFSGAGGGGLSSWKAAPNEQTARVTPDGRHLAFMSVAGLTGFDNLAQGDEEPVSQVYLYSADSNKLVCPSCNPAGARPTGFSELPVWITPYEQPRYLSDDGGRLFFLSFDALDLSDTNGKQDVYEFEREGSGSCTSLSPTFNSSSSGCLYLISPGSSGDDSYFLDASVDGRDVFISTRQRLLPADEDERYDVYDARIGGGFASPPPPPPACAGEACRPAEAAPSSSYPASAGFTGDGNATPRNLRACGRKQARRGKRCVSKAKLAQRICRKKSGVAKRRCIRKQTNRRIRTTRRAAR
jgi:Tol biopolymer transport system component